MASITCVPSVAFLLEVGYAPEIIKARLEERLELAIFREQYQKVLGTNDIETIYDYHKQQPAVGP